MTIYERIDKAYQEIAQATFKKDKWVGKWIVTRDENNKRVRQPDLDHDGYFVISITQILDVVQKAHAHNGIKCIFEGPYYNAENNEKRITVPWRDGKRVIANAHYDVRIYGESDEDVIYMKVQCEAWDTEANDKLGNKLLTNAQRSLYRSLYAIDGDDTQDPEEQNPAVQGDPAEEPAEKDKWFSKKEPKTEAEVKTPDEGKLDAETRAKMKKATEGRNQLCVFAKQNPECTIIVEAKKMYGDTILDWADGATLHVMEELEEAGLL